jgi:hypothetical protein
MRRLFELGGGERADSLARRAGGRTPRISNRQPRWWGSREHADTMQGLVTVLANLRGPCHEKPRPFLVLL